MTKSITLIQNCATEGGGKIPAELERLGIPTTLIHAYNNEPFPKTDDIAGAIVLGTPISIREYLEHDYLKNEHKFLATMIRANMPVLGICFGSQILAHVLGARVERNAQLEIGTLPVKLTPEAVPEMMFRGFPDEFPVFQWHGDTFRVPHGAVHHATSDLCKNQAFSKGNCWGIQFHFEPTAEDVAAYAEAYPEELKEVGLNAETLLQSFKDSEANIEQSLRLLIANFTSLLK